uniref:Uncharacterized protein n=1 Tax=Chromera velia CCMP2878 TaxID=1169474 RepID=A0A0G4I8I9_9ALVE|eukprot:Cvel_11881.t1-p1 / transcript=Cvel_11881.t1 / gene=Cvel_11881 / organism=Chromera_velia_CCMP2878 / gene_product=hypothetical protein / transcript_product=hypothetical protein / location=Cvel_scaffold759:45189-46956(-) / protein_length=436 / sequence_SO=supercontig / SO=protein_coding / is_pseudo=false
MLDSVSTAVSLSGDRSPVFFEGNFFDFPLHDGGRGEGEGRDGRLPHRPLHHPPNANANARHQFAPPPTLQDALLRHFALDDDAHPEAEGDGGDFFHNLPHPVVPSRLPLDTQIPVQHINLPPLPVEAEGSAARDRNGDAPGEGEGPLLSLTTQMPFQLGSCSRSRIMSRRENHRKRIEAAVREGQQPTARPPQQQQRRPAQQQAAEGITRNAVDPDPPHTAASPPAPTRTTPAPLTLAGAREGSASDRAGGRRLGLRLALPSRVELDEGRAEDEGAESEGQQEERETVCCSVQRGRGEDEATEVDDGVPFFCSPEPHGGERRKDGRRRNREEGEAEEPTPSRSPSIATTATKATETEASPGEKTQSVEEELSEVVWGFGGEEEEETAAKKTNNSQKQTQRERKGGRGLSLFPCLPSSSSSSSFTSSTSTMTPMDAE